MRKEYDFSKGVRGPVLPSKGKTRITIMLDSDVIEAFREKAEAEGVGYQTAINEALRGALKKKEAPLTASALRKILRQELSAG
ncbi:MAG: hypothetical protein JWQ90_4071 [Hydrocarboniphaga sp.]|uniref:BrnA antitoxin family protein n=1 Tax=Hydrocarboniphaga sp. TaxID=2033016 RepID=UPI0026071FAA|nr:BrnA antitoxin family protein [Hydrocarboniphaga sp.]MDB5971621.1 hypothetical protein [Hydrocarboniphaga sp.]